MKRNRSSASLAPWMPGVLLEAAAVVVVGVGLALLANGLSPRGIELGRDYFPDHRASGGPQVDTGVGAASLREAPGTRSGASLIREDQGQPEGLPNQATSQETLMTDTNGTSDGAISSSAAALERRLGERGLALVRLPEVQAWFEDPGYDAELILFVDARNRKLYEDGHIPAAHRFDHFYPQETLAEVLPAALAAQWVVVYCNGGDCEDSEFAATFLRDAGVPSERLHVYAGGLEEWQAAGLPIELGPRRSGVLRTP